MKQAIVNQALEELLSTYGWRKSEEALVARSHGAAALALAREVYAFALNYPVNWQTTTLAAALAALRLTLQAKYPFLTPDRVQQLIGHFATPGSEGG